MSVRRNFTIPYTSGTQVLAVTDSGQTAAYASNTQQFFAGSIGVSVWGTATLCSVQVQRSATGPDDPLGVNFVPADIPITGNPSTGLTPVIYTEPSFGWWRVNVTSITGGSLNTSISGITI